jgi:hypothetical protein
MILNRFLLDERCLFPSAIIGGFAKLLLDRYMPEVRVKGLLSRGWGEITLSADIRGQKALLGVNYRVQRDFECVITNFHRRRKVVGDTFGAMRNDKGPPLLEIDPKLRPVLRASRYSYRMYMDSGLKGGYIPIEELAKARHEINLSISRRALDETFTAAFPRGTTMGVLPVAEYSKTPALFAA